MGLSEILGVVTIVLLLVVIILSTDWICSK